MSTVQIRINQPSGGGVAFKIEHDLAAHL
eukprot:COSAG06_NODE_58495_length_277_cov_0.516854_1_plen_28_part_01